MDGFDRKKKLVLKEKYFIMDTLAKIKKIIFTYSFVSEQEGGN